MRNGTPAPSEHFLAEAKYIVPETSWEKQYNPASPSALEVLHDPILHHELYVSPSKVDKIETITPETLYQDPANSIIRFREQLNNCLGFIDEALASREVLEIEQTMHFYFEHVYKLAEFTNLNTNLCDVIIHLQVAASSHLTKIYTRDHLAALKTTLNYLKNNVYMNEEIKIKCILIIDEAGFDTNAPFADVDLNE